jgi:hypothetical protein
MKFPPGYGYPSLRDWELKRLDEERFQRWKKWICRTVAIMKGDH